MNTLLQVVLALGVLAVLEGLYYLVRWFRDSRRHELQRRLQSLGREKDQGCLDGLLLTPVDRSALYFGKLVGNFVFMVSLRAKDVPRNGFQEDRVTGRPLALP